jgi:broad specificity polyphosphatase/5'/3'-nucleotidase SurE
MRILVSNDDGISSASVAAEFGVDGEEPSAGR